MTAGVTWNEVWRGDHFELSLSLAVASLSDLFDAATPNAARIFGGTLRWDGIDRTIASGTLLLFEGDTLRYAARLADGGSFVAEISLPSLGTSDSLEGDAIAQLQRLRVRFPPDGATHIARAAGALPPFFEPTVTGPEDPDSNGLREYRGWLREKLRGHFDFTPIPPAETPFADHEWRVFALAFEAFFPSSDPNGPSPRAVADRVEELMRLAKPGYFSPLHHALGKLEALARESQFVAAQLRALVKNLASKADTWEPARTLHDVLVFAYYAHPDADRVVAYQRPEPGPTRVSDPIFVVHEADEVTALLESVDPWDVVVVGSGPAGGIVADRLATAGKRVLILEEGPFVPATHTNTDELAGIASLYKDSGLQQGKVKEGHDEARLVILQGGCVGGGASVNNAICFKMHSQTHERWQSAGFPISSEELQRAYATIADELSIVPVREAESGDGEFSGQNPAFNYVRDAWGTPEVPPSGEPTPGFFDVLVNVQPGADPCLSLGLSNIGTYSARKRSVVEVHLPRATARANCSLVAEATVEKLEIVGSLVKRVRVRVGGKSYRVRTRHVVLAAGAIGSAKILHRSHGMSALPIGRRFSCNLATPLFAAYDHQVHSDHKVQMSHYFHGTDGEPGWLVETWFNPPASHALVLQGLLDVHQARMRDYAKMIGFGIVASSRPTGTIDAKGKVELPLGAHELLRCKEALNRTLNALFASSSPPRYALVAYDHGIVVCEHYQVALAMEDMNRVSDLLLSTSHPQGGAAMSDDDAIGVVQHNFKVRGVQNLRVADASLFPLAAGVNPQWTVMALADLCASSLLLDP